MSEGSEIVELMRKMTRAIDIGKGMFMPADYLSILLEVGAFEALQAKAAEYLREQDQERAALRRSRQSEGFGSTGGQIENNSSSPGTTPSQDGNETLAQVREILWPRGRSPSSDANEAYQRALAITRPPSKRGKAKPIVHLAASRPAESDAGPVSDAREARERVREMLRPRGKRESNRPGAGK